jgi:putative DNA primase/helicase
MTLLEAALAYAERGWPVFPCHPATKRPLTKNGFEDATTDARAIKVWWGRYPKAMIGVPTGVAIGAFVIDLDLGDPQIISGKDYLDRFLAYVGGMPPTAIVETGSGGYHIYFAWNTRQAVANGAKVVPALTLGPAEGATSAAGGKAKPAQVDLRGEGGYVIVPPSVRADGRAYCWAQPLEDGIAEATPRIWDVALKRELDQAKSSTLRNSATKRAHAPVDAPDKIRRYALAALEREAGELANAAPGSRGWTMNKSAFAIGQLVGAGALSHDEAYAQLHAAACSCGLVATDGLRSVEKNLDRALRQGSGQPRDLAEIARERKPAQRRMAAGGGLPAEASSPASPQPHRDADGQSATLAPGEVTGSPPDEPEGPDNETLEYCAGLDHSDTDNGKRLIAYFGRDLLVMQQEGVAGGDWLAWDGTHWDLGGGAAGATKKAQLVGDRILLETEYMFATPAEAKAIDAGEAAAAELKTTRLGEDASEEQRERVAELKRQLARMAGAREALYRRKAARAKFGISSKNKSRIEAMLACAAPHLRRHPDAFNADQMLVATKTHTLRFIREADPECPDPDVLRYKARVEAIAGHRREDLITALVPIDYLPDYEATGRWNAFVRRFLPDDTVRRTVQQFAGLGLLGQPIQRIMFHVGTGANGKSTFLEVITRVLGDTFAVGLPAESITGFGERGAGQASPDLARLFGKRMLRVLELPAGKPLQQELIKKLTGGEKIPVRTLFKGFFEFQPLCKAHMSGNDYPTIDGSDGGLKRRLLVVPWTVTIPEAEQRDIEEVVRELLAEAPAILNWLIAGALDYLENGLVVGDPIRSLTKEYFDDQDPVGVFAGDCVEQAPGETVAARAMYIAYQAWSEANAKKPVSETRFARTMKKKGFARDETSRVRLYLNIRLHDVPERLDGGAGDRHTASIGGYDEVLR